MKGLIYVLLSDNPKSIPLCLCKHFLLLAYILCWGAVPIEISCHIICMHRPPTHWHLPHLEQYCHTTSWHWQHPQAHNIHKELGLLCYSYAVVRHQFEFGPIKGWTSSIRTCIFPLDTLCWLVYRCAYVTASCQANKNTTLIPARSLTGSRTWVYVCA